MFNNKKIFILGMARSGFACAKLLSEYNNQILITDNSQEPDLEKVKILESLGVEFISSTNPIDLLDETYDILIKNPGVKPDHKTILKAQKLNIPVINEMEVGYHFLPKNTEIIGITGSNGKTTTTRLAYEILKLGKTLVVLAGNIGIPLTEIANRIPKNAILLCEISDHQLLNMDKFKCNTSIVTNITETHIDFHGTFEKYKQTKARIFKEQTKDDFAILNKQNQNVMDIANNILSKVITFNDELNYYDEEFIYIDGKEYLKRNDLVLKGDHNCENILVAILLGRKYKVADDKIKEAIKSFKGEPHRLEFIANIDGVSYYNDSKATNIESTKIALKSFSNPTIIILGGEERGQNLEGLTEAMKNVKDIFAIGECRDRIKNYANIHNIPCTSKEFLKEAMPLIFKTAKNGDTVLLSTATGSWDQYKRFEDRGDEFVSLILEHQKTHK